MARNDTQQHDTPQCFYNGEEYSGDPEDIVTLESGPDLNVKRTGKTIDTIYSFMQWEESDTAEAEEYDVSDITDTGSLLGYDFETDAEGNIQNNSFELLGVNALSEIKPGNIVYVYDSEEDGQDDVIRRVAVGTEIIEGEITKDDAEEKEWTVKGKTYKFSQTDDADTYGKSTGEAGDVVKLWLDAYGEIYMVESAKRYAIVKNISESEEKAKIFTEDGESNSYQINVSSTDWQAIVNMVGNDATAAAKTRLIGYGLNRDNQIDFIYPSYGDENSSDRKTAEVINGSDQVSIVGSSVLSYSDAQGEKKTISIDAKAVIFTKDQSGDFDITAMEDVDKEKDTPNLNAVAGMKAEVLLRGGNIISMIINDDFVSGAKKAYAVISGADDSVNNIGEKAQELTGFLDGVKMNELYTTDRNVVRPSDISTVSAFRIRYDQNNNISKIDEAGTIKDTYVRSGTVVGNSVKSGDGYVEMIDHSTGETVFGTVSKKAVIYEVVLKNGGSEIDEYKVYHGTINPGNRIWLFEVNDKVDGNDIVVVQK